MITYLTILFSMGADPNDVTILRVYPSQYECGEALLDVDASGGLSFHCHELDILGSTPRPVSNPRRQAND